jgi:charged multivesicular body protein 4
MKRKKQKEEHLDRLEKQAANIESMMFQLQNSVTDVETLKAQKQAAVFLKKQTKELGGIEKVQKTMDEIKDIMDDARDLSDVITKPVIDDFIDEDDLEDELGKLEEQVRMPNAIKQDVEVTEPFVEENMVPEEITVSDTAAFSEEDTRELEALAAEMK